MLLSGSPGLYALVERKITEAIARGEFDNLPGAGKPLDLDDDPLVPEELRIANRILRNAGFVPPELAQLAQVNQLIASIERSEIAADETSPGARRLRALLIQLELSGREATSRGAWLRYQDALAQRLGRP
jgi:hypothetical protein